MVRTAGFVRWPMCQECMAKECKNLFFVNLVIDGEGSYYVCTDPEHCEYDVDTDAINVSTNTTR